MDRVTLAMVLAAIVVLPPGTSLHSSASRLAPGLRLTAPVAVATPATAASQADLGAVPATASVRQLSNDILATNDNAQRSFVVINKRDARLFVIDASGRLIGDTPVLLGAATGDDSVPGIGDRPIGDILPFERTTPAGRFVAESGRNTHGDPIVWVDYDAAISMHAVRATNPRERRLARLASPTASDNRISYGCINLPAAFFEQVIGPMFGEGRHMVYILPDRKTDQEVFDFGRRRRDSPRG